MHIGHSPSMALRGFFLEELLEVARVGTEQVFMGYEWYFFLPPHVDGNQLFTKSTRSQMQTMSYTWRIPPDRSTRYIVCSLAYGLRFGFLSGFACTSMCHDVFNIAHGSSVPRCSCWVPLRKRLEIISNHRYQYLGLAGVCNEQLFVTMSSISFDTIQDVSSEQCCFDVSDIQLQCSE